MSTNNYIKRRFGILDENSITDYSSVPPAKNPFESRNSLEVFMQKSWFQNLYSATFIIYYIHAFISVEFRDSVSEAFIYFMVIETSCLLIITSKTILSLFVPQQTSISAWRMVETICILIACVFLLFELTSAYSSSELVFKIFSVLRFIPLILQMKIISKIKKRRRFSVIPFKTNSERLLSILNHLRGLKWVARDKDLDRELEWGINCICTQSLYNVEVQAENKEQEEAIMWAMTERPKSSLVKLVLNELLAEMTELDHSQPVLECLKKINKLSFDVFSLKSLTSNNELVVLTSHLFHTNNICRAEKISRPKFNNFIKAVQSGYNVLPYHNCTHAADVVQAFHYFLVGCEVKDLYELSLAEYTICILSACIHDYQHPGRTNAFLVNTKHELAILYNDNSVLENHHVAACFKLMQNSDCGIFDDLPGEAVRKYRSSMIELVLATDFSRHFKDLAKFKLRFNKENEKEGETHKSSMLKMLMHAADVSNSTRKWETYYEWAQRVLTEFYSQGDEEKAKGINISPLCDRSSVKFGKSQIGFIDMFISPIFGFLAEINSNFYKAKRNVERNRAALASLKDEDCDDEAKLTS